MRAVVQRVKRASVDVAGRTVSQIGRGLVVLVGIGTGDDLEDARFIAQKCVHLRIFEDERGVMNRSLLDAGGGILLVSQFTLMADARKGRRPSYFAAMAPEPAKELFENTVKEFEQLCSDVRTGVFQAHMEVSLINEGPVTILLDSKKEF